MPLLSKENVSKYFSQQSHIAPLAVFRIIFGGVMFTSILRFILKGWVYELYVMPRYFFPFYGFEWIKPFNETGMYLTFAILALSALLILFGLFYRAAALIFFLCVTYVELIDKSNYLNHYYFVCIISFLLILVPAHRYFSLDVLRKPASKVTHVPRWTIDIFKIQLGIVYFFAGIAKLNYDWLFRAMPLQIWLPAKTHLPLIGWLFDYKWVAFFFSWFGLVYDLTIPFLLILKRTRTLAYVLVILFHITTSLLFPIGMFPYIMMMATLLFFSEQFHNKVITGISQALKFKESITNETTSFLALSLFKRRIIFSILTLFFLFQVVFPFRHLLYPGKLFWTEQGYRFSWRVMLMEKAGTAFFYVKDPKTGRESEVMNCDYLTKNQEKMMSTQPDMMIQFAHLIKKDFEKRGIEDPQVRVESYVTLNGSGSRLFIDPTVDLTKQEDSFSNKSWILPFIDLSKKSTK